MITLVMRRSRVLLSTLFQLGENWWGLHDMAKSVAVGASDLVMVDVMKIGGVTVGCVRQHWPHPPTTAFKSYVPGDQRAPARRHSTVHWLEYLDLAGTVLQTKSDSGEGIRHALFFAWDRPQLAGGHGRTLPSSIEGQTYCALLRFLP